MTYRICDTCGVATDVWHEWETCNDPEQRVVFEDPVWQVCEGCNSLILKEDRKVMLQRALLILGDTVDIAMAMPGDQALMRIERKDSIRYVHDAFWEYLIRPDKEEPDAEAAE